MRRADEKYGNMMEELDDYGDGSKQTGSYGGSSRGFDYLQSQGKDLRDRIGAPSKMSKDEEAIENFGSVPSSSAKQTPANNSGVDYSVMKNIVMRSCRVGESPVLCYVEREKYGFGFLQQLYRCYLEVEGQSKGRFLMTAKKMGTKKTSYYLVSMDQNPDDRGSESVIGKIRGNGIGSQYLFTDHGLSPEKSVAPSNLRKEHGVATFAFSSGGPSQLVVYVPSVGSNGSPVVWQPSSEEYGMPAKINAGNVDRMSILVNKKPKWDDVHGGHVLNFQGRVTESSVKNFQMVLSNDIGNDEVVLQFGRVGKDKFSMDVKYPLSLFQAFCICVSSMDNKLADRKGYEFYKSIAGGPSNPPPVETSSSIANNNNSNNNGNGSGNGGYSNSTINSTREATGSNSTSSNGSNSNPSTVSVSGSLQGNRGFTSSIRESLPTTQYLRDKISRTFG